MPGKRRVGRDRAFFIQVRTIGGDWMDFEEVTHKNEVKPFKGLIGSGHTRLIERVTTTFLYDLENMPDE